MPEQETTIDCFSSLPVTIAPARHRKLNLRFRLYISSNASRVKQLLLRQKMPDETDTPIRLVNSFLAPDYS